MVCNKCGAKTQSLVSCPVCGSSDIIQTSAAELAQVEESPHRVSTRLKVYSIIVFVASAIAIILYSTLISATTSYPNDEFFSPNVKLAIYYISIVLILFEVTLMIFILRLKRWALNTYLVLIIISLILDLFQGDFLKIIINVALLAFVFQKDYDYFT
ncbi:MAG: hypothetical protein PHY15_00430 [Eubacteriales bacterium]|nr:hypothetical protein [Eubacteriales bacterium]MDD4474687.1 hypothetical protein [Eubacteriales bacterium]